MYIILIITFRIIEDAITQQSLIFVAKILHSCSSHTYLEKRATDFYVHFVLKSFEKIKKNLFLHVNVSAFVHNSRTKGNENAQGIHGRIYGKSKISAKV